MRLIRARPEKDSTTKAAKVVSAEPSSAPPVVAKVRCRAVSMSVALRRSSSKRFVTCTP
jgi:hypothetical protein